MPSLLSRLGQAARIITGREERGIPPPSAVFTSQYGIPALFNSGESLRAYGDNVHLYRAVLSIAMGAVAPVPSYSAAFERDSIGERLESLRRSLCPLGKEATFS